MESPLPTYSLYGEQGRTLAVDWLHCESIAERSRMRDWEINAHRHELLYQLFWIERGGCELSLDGQLIQIAGPCLLLLPPPVVHGFSFEPEIDGLVVTVLAEHIQQLLAQEAGLKTMLAQPRALRLEPAQAEHLRRAAAVLLAEFRGADRWRALAIDSALLQLLVSCGRCLNDDDISAPQGRSRAQTHVQRYRQLIEQRYREQPALGSCARALGITPTQLNRLCQQVLGCSALAVLHARLLLEAQRELAYTTMSIKQIAHDLGFSDAAYFTRFFLRQTGLAPTAWRARSAQRSGSGTDD